MKSITDPEISNHLDRIKMVVFAKEVQQKLRRQRYMRLFKHRQCNQ